MSLSSRLCKFRVPFRNYDIRFEDTRFDWKTRYGPNSVGVKIIATLSPDLKLVAARGENYGYQDQATQVLLALHRYSKKHGEFPSGLSLLVLDLIDSVPKNSYGADSLIYDPQKRQLRPVRPSKGKWIFSLDFPHLDLPK